MIRSTMNHPGWDPDWTDPTSSEVERWQAECAALAAAECAVDGHVSPARIHEVTLQPGDTCLRCGERDV